MGHRAPEHVSSLGGYPNISAAAKLIGVAPSTLSRRADLRVQGRGDRDRVLRATEVLRLARVYRKRSLNDVAQGLIDLARRAAPEEANRVEAEIEQFFEEHIVSEESRDEFLDLARRLLPPSLYEQVEEIVATRGAALPEGLLGQYPLPDS